MAKSDRWWFKQAMGLQARNRESEGLKAEQYTEDEVNRSVVYTREDIAALVGLIEALNRQTDVSRRILIAILIVLCCLAAKVIFK